MTNSTVILNNAAQAAGGGIYAFNAPVTIHNSIVAANIDDGTAPDVRKSPSAALTVLHSLIGTNVGTDLIEDQDGDANGNFIGGTTGGLIDPLLGELADNGGPTRTHALLDGSLALNSGDSALAVDPSNGDAPLTTDQRGAGFDRNVGGTVDMGAFEAQVPTPITLVVDNATDEDDGDTSEGDLSLREAVRLANENAGAADTITFAPALNGTTILVTLGQMSITDSVTIRGNGASNTILDAGQASRFFNVGGSHVDVSIDSLMLRNGRDANNSGGAIRSLADAASTLTIANSTFSSNSVTLAVSFGGAIAVFDGDVIVTDSLFLNNSTLLESSNGGAIYAGGGDVTITRSEFRGNSTAGSASAGGALTASRGNLTISDSTFSGNSTTGGGFSNGGAVFSGAGHLTILNSTFDGNRVSSGGSSGGGGGGGGGGGANGGGGDGSNGGAIHAFGDVTIVNSTFSGNHADGAQGGAISFGDGDVVLINSTLTGNSARSGGGLQIIFEDSTGTLTLQNSIVAGNTADSNPDFAAPNNPAENLVVQYSLIGDNDGTGLAATVGATPDANGNFIGSHAAPLNPQLAPLADNGGTTRTHALLADSLAMNHGSNALAVDPTNDNSPLTSDQRGAPFSRTFGGTADMGAYERHIYNFVVDNATDEDDGDTSTGDLSLREAVRLSNENGGAADTITFATALNGTTIFVTLGQMAITDSVTIHGNGAGVTVLDAGRNSRFFDATGDIHLTIEGITFQNGKAPLPSPFSLPDNGGAIRFFANAGGALTVRDSVFQGNSTSRGSGGAIAIVAAELLIERCTFESNSAQRPDGGTLPTYGGAVYVYLSANDGTAIFRDSGFFANSAVTTGGALDLSNGEAYVFNSTFSGNSSSDYGGAIVNQSRLFLIHSTLTGNQAGTQGGGLAQASVGRTTIRNSIIGGNTALETDQFDLYIPTGGFAPMVSHSLIGSVNGSRLNETGTAAPDANGNYVGGSIGGLIDPMLGELANNGGPTKTHALLPGSLALNRGSNALAVDPSDDNAPLAFDQRGTGFPRIVGANVDMGAFESPAEPPQIAGFAGSVLYPAGNPPIVLDADATVTDPDSTNFAGGNLTIAITANAQATDRLAIRDQGVGLGLFRLIGNVVIYGFDVAVDLGNGQVQHVVESRVIGTFEGGHGTDPLIIRFDTYTPLDVVQALLRNITFHSTVPNPSTATRTVTVTLTDDTGLTSDAVTKTVTLAVSRPPVINNFGTGVAWTEGTTPVLLSGVLVAVTDPDSADFNGGTLTVALTSNARPGDVLGVRNQGTGLQQISVNGNNILYRPSLSTSAVVIGTLSGGTNGNPLVITLTSAAANPAAVAAVLKNLTFSSTSDDPTNAVRTVSVTLFDGDGGTSVPVTKTISVVPINDASVLNNFGGPSTYTEDGPRAFLDADATITDADSPDFANGTIVVQTTVNGQSTDQLFIASPNATELGTVTVTSIPGTTASNVLVDGVLVGKLTGGVNGSSMTVLFNANATVSRATAVLQSIQFWNTSHTPSNKPRTLLITLTDGDGGKLQKTTTMNVVPVNDAAVIGGVPVTPVTFQGPPVLPFSTATLTDLDTTNFNGGRLMIAPDIVRTGDLIGIRNQGVSLGQINVIGNQVRVGLTAIGTISGGANGAPLLIVLNANASTANVQALMRNITFSTTLPGSLPRTLSMTLQEADGTSSNTVARMVHGSVVPE